MDTINSLTNDELVSYYSSVIKELKTRQIIRSNNVVGDLGEYFAIKHYNDTKGLPKLQQVPPSTKNIDAISVDGERYSIKSTTSKTSSVFYGLNPPDSTEKDDRKFEYVLIVLLDENYSLKQINEVTWQQFLTHRKWHSTMQAWNLTATKKLLNSTKTIYMSEQ